MRRYWRLLAAVLWATLLTGVASRSVLAQGSPVGSQAGASMVTVAEQYLLRSINGERTAAGLPPVAFDPELQQAARFHATQMAHANTLSHQLQGEPDLSARGSSSGAQFSRITENVAVGPSILAMHTALMHSPHHRDNILDNQVNTVGISVLEANGSLWAVEDFSKSVERLTLVEQERRVSSLLRGLQLDAAPSREARTTCTMTSGYVGARPAFTMRYTTGDLTRLPEQLRVRMQTEAVHAAAVGACGPPKDHGGFASYNIAVVLYR